jgi:hypothetical protein
MIKPQVHSHRFQALQYGGIYQQANYYKLLRNLETKQRERRGKTYLISYKLSEYGTSECHRPLSQFGPNQALEHKWQQQGITPCYDEDPVLIFKVELHPTKSISAQSSRGKKNGTACAQVLVYTFSSTERGCIQHVWILKLHSLKAEINL